MKLLIVTQVVDTEDPVLGFFHRWIEEFAGHYETIHVVCLKEGRHSLPANVHVHSLGKEEGKGRLTYLLRFYRYIWQLRKEYDAVFVHMNQEYVLLGAGLWKLLKKKLFLWRNHYAGSWSTDVAAKWCTKIFCTSRYSYTAKYAHTKIMPVGIDTMVFTPSNSIKRLEQSVLFLARMAPSKNPETLLNALEILHKEGIVFTATFVGDPLPEHEMYYQRLQQRVLKESLPVGFLGGVPNKDTVELYRSHRVFVNTSPSGMYDKTIFEAMACGTLVIVSNENLQGVIDDRFLFRYNDDQGLAERLKGLLDLSFEEKDKAANALIAVAERHSLQKLGRLLKEEMMC